MVMRKVLERLVTDDKKELLETLFKEVWYGILKKNVSVTVIYPKTTPIFSLLATQSLHITNFSYDDFNKLFMFLKKANVDFSLDGKQLVVTVIDVDNFIDELRLLADSKKYNIL